MKRWSKNWLILSLTGSLLLAGAYAGAQAPPPPESSTPGETSIPANPKGATPSTDELSKPMGYVSFELQQFGPWAGVGLGKGALDYKGKQYSFKVRGIQARRSSLTKMTARGEIYNLLSVDDFPGRYSAIKEVNPNTPIIKGRAKQDFKNSNGVHIIFRGTGKSEANFSIAPEGFVITSFEKAMKP